MRPFPSEEVEFLASLTPQQRNSRLRHLHEAGWSLANLSEAVNTPKTTIHFWIKNAQPVSNYPNRVLPAPPKSITALIRSPYSTRVRSMSPKVPPDLRPRLAHIGQLARRYRSRTPATSSTALANAELTQLAVSLRKQGVSTADIADAAGVSYRAMARRITNGMKEA